MVLHYLLGVETLSADLRACMKEYLSCPQKVPVKSSKPMFQTMDPQLVLQQPLTLWERIGGTVGCPCTSAGSDSSRMMGKAMIQSSRGGNGRVAFPQRL